MAVSVDPPPPFEPARLPSKELVWSWIETINGFGPRLTGSDAQRDCIDFVAAEIDRIGLTVCRDRRCLQQRWQPARWALSVSGASPREIAIASPFPYSGRTPPQGVSGEIVWYNYPPLGFGRAKGKIAVVNLPTISLSPMIASLVTARKAAIPPDADLTRSERTPLISGLLPLINLQNAARAGVLAVICVWRGCAEDDVRNQYLPFTTPYSDCPALWVGSAAGDALRAACDRGDRVNLVLDADLDNDIETDTIYAVLPGTDPSESIIINTHSDGPNAAEENGAAGLLALMRYFAGLPETSRRRTMIFALVTGHFQLPQLGNKGQATKAWLEQHPDFWDGAPGHRRAVAGLTLEHLGCTEWKENDSGDYGPTGRLEREIVYVTNKTMQDIYLAATQGRDKLRSLVVGPRNGFFFGEAQPLFDVGIPSISLCPLPNYLCAVLDGGGIDRLDPDLAYEQIATFAKALLAIDATPTRSIGGVDRDRTAFVSKLLKLLPGSS